MDEYTFAERTDAEQRAHPAVRAELVRLRRIEQAAHPAVRAELARLRRIEQAARAFVEIHASLADGAQVRAKFGELYEAVDGGA